MSENLLQLIDAEKAYGTRVLFTGATVSINRDEHIGVIGPNGAGKSTFFKILTGDESMDKGRLVRSKELSLGYLSQHDHWNEGETGNQFLERTTTIPLWEVKSRGRELKVSEEMLDKPITSLSGGYRMRVKLLALLGQAPNLMLLDEPTNYLDLETTLLLERFLQSFDGAFLLISHDREFLRRTTDHTLEIEAGEFMKFPGNIDDYFEQKELLAEQLRARAANLADKRASVMEFITRFGAKATKARQAQSKMKQLEKMEVIEIKPLRASAVIKIPKPTHTGEQVLQVENAHIGYGERKILTNVNLRIKREDHIGIVGYNGVGKSTLLKSLAGTLAPQSGEVKPGHNVRIAFFHQHVVEALDPRDDVYSSLAAGAHPEVLRQEILDMAGSLLFSGDDVKKPISVLSGGECSRVALGRVLLQKAPVLILDEPTNHLDFQTVEALTQALHAYPGTLITVSHDRGFIQRVANKIVEIKDGDAHLYPGTYEEYVWRIQKELSAEDVDAAPVVAATKSAPEGAVAKPTSSGTQSYQEKKEAEKKRRQDERRLKSVEEEMSYLQPLITGLTDKLSGGLQGPELQSAIKDLGEKTERMNTLEQEWLELSETLAAK
ncbi:MAG: ABC-F family ATP-binding cassette domain-containing protein [Bdellovibrionaceae bacterium]|nr:ABC-F family ATP-binding cassette domain-containing protein [Pseudobdellovibrionaceae bacterium]